MIHLKSTATLAKSFSVKREKGDDDSEGVVAHLKIADCLVDRDQLDELLGLPVGWSTGALYDDFGAPLSRLTLSVARRELLFTGVLRDGSELSAARLKLKDAEISGITLELTKLGALLACQLSWVAAGDEVDDIADMLGAICALDAVVSDGGQKDLLKDGVQAAADSIRKLAQQDGIESVELQIGGKTIAKFGKDSEPPPRSNRISSFNQVMRLIESGYHLRGADPDYWVERPDGSERQGVWLNAARACLKQGLEPIGDGDTDEVGRWKLRSAA
jgi:hypothetical protein